MLVTGKHLTTLRRNNRPYAVLRASHNYLVTDFFLTLLLHLYAALPHLRAGKTDALNLGRRKNASDCRSGD
jgi:cytochrome b561